LADLIQLHKDKPEFTEGYLRRMAMTNFGAGHETVTSALTSTFAMIGSHPDVQGLVLEESLSAPETIDYDSTTLLPYTQASIKEAQRLYPTIGMSLPRKVPEGGLRVHGYFFPPGTTVGCNPVSLHRNPEIFGPDSDLYLPDRWLGCETDVKVMERHNLTWGSGARACPGRQLAEMLLYKIVPSLVREFEIEAAMPSEDEMPYYFMAILTGVKVRFKTRDRDGLV
jgi:cytochrome P450